MPGRLRMALIILSLVATVNCGTSTTAPSTSLTGTWVGTENDTVAGIGNLQATLAQNGSTLSGTYALTFPNPIFSNGGTLSGTVNGSSVLMTATPTNLAICPALDTATLNSTATQITGTYAAVAGCIITNQMGSFTAVKQ